MDLKECFHRCICKAIRSIAQQSITNQSTPICTHTHTESYLHTYIAIDTFGLYMYIYLYTHHRKNEWLLIESFSLRFFCICGRAYRRRRLTKNAIAFSVIEPCVIFISISPVNFLHFCFFSRQCVRASARCMLSRAYVGTMEHSFLPLESVIFARCLRKFPIKYHMNCV